MIRARETADLILSEMGTIDPSIVSFTDQLEEGAPYQVEPPRKSYQTAKYQRFLFEHGHRIESAFRRYIHRGDELESPETVVIVCHANVIRYFLMRAMQVDPSAWLRFSLNHGSVTKIRVYGSGDIRALFVGESGFMPNDHVTSR